MEFRDIPKAELDIETYSDKTLASLMSVKKAEYNHDIKRSAARNIPLIIGSYICICAVFAGYAVANNESIFVFNIIYIALLYLWIPVLAILPALWWLRRPTEKELIEEIGWYKELLNSSADFEA